MTETNQGVRDRLHELGSHIARNEGIMSAVQLSLKETDARVAVNTERIENLRLRHGELKEGIEGVRSDVSDLRTTIAKWGGAIAAIGILGQAYLRFSGN